MARLPFDGDQVGDGVEQGAELGGTIQHAIQHQLAAASEPSDDPLREVLRVLQQLQGQHGIGLSEFYEALPLVIRVEALLREREDENALCNVPCVQSTGFLF